MSRSAHALLVVFLLLALLSVGQTLAQKSPPSVPEMEPASGTSNPVRLPIIYNGWEPSPRVISCLGDSVTHGFPYVGTDQTYPARLQAMLDSAHGPASFEVINHGVTGYRADQVLADLQALNWMDDDPDFVLLMVGGNDLAQETPFLGLSETIERTVGEVQAIIDVVKSHTNADGSQPGIIVSAFIPNLILDYWGSDAIAQYNASLESNLTGVDLWTADNWDDFYDPTTEQARISLMSDLVHPNVEGYRVVAQNWFEAIEALLSTSGESTMLPDVPTSAEAAIDFDLSVRLNLHRYTNHVPTLSNPRGQAGQTP
ncbi:MAG: SGNH/GDSL hydrolase family protein [Anaerolineae bacterium]|nr:SGNH/GDSL hydrolase family protein [Anaerolineae bacterium]